MKKKIFALAFVAMSLVSMPVFAQSNQSDKCTKTDKKECVDKKKCKGNKAFEGLNLTDAQKQQLKQLGEKRREAAKAARQQKQATDSVARAERREAKKGYLNDVKSVLTPDQYVVFLENFYLSTPQNNGQGGKAFKGARKVGGPEKGKNVESRRQHRPTDKANFRGKGKAQRGNRNGSQVVEVVETETVTE